MLGVTACGARALMRLASKKTLSAKFGFAVIHRLELRDDPGAELRCISVSINELTPQGNHPKVPI
jgi:hypothetical protein